VNGATVALTDDDFSTTVNLSEGSNSIDVVATDGSNQTAEESVTVTLDTVSPQLSLAPSSGSTLASTIPIFTLTYTDPSPGTGLDTATLEVFLDGQDVTAQVQVQPDQATFQPAAPLGDGSHSIVSRARDVAGNTGETSSTFSIDSVAPFLTSNIASGSTISTSTPTLVATYADPDPGSGVDVSSFQAFLDGNSITSSFTVGSLQASFQIPRGSGLSDASHSLEYRIADNVSHQSVVTVNLLVDTQGPVVSIDEPRDGVELQTSVPTIQISYSDAGTGVNPASLVIALDGENRTADFVIGAATAVFQVPSTEPLAGGPHSLVVNVTDVIGNESTAVSSFSVNPSVGAPSVPSDAGHATGLVFDGASGNPLPGATVQVLGQAGVIFTGPSGRYGFPVSPGDYRVLVSADGYGGPIERSVVIQAGRDTAIEEIILLPIDTQVSSLEASTGGIASNSDGSISITFPPGTLSTDADFRITRVFEPESATGDLPPNHIAGAGFMIEEPAGLTLNGPVTVAISNDRGLSPGHQLVVQTFNEKTGCWEISGSGEVSEDGGLLVATTFHLSDVYFH